MTDPGGVPGFDLGSLFSQLGEVQRNLREAQEEAAAAEVVGTAGGGAVKVKVSGGLEFLEVKIDPSVVDPADIEMLEDLVLAAIRDGVDQASSLASGASPNAEAIRALSSIYSKASSLTSVRRPISVRLVSTPTMSAVIGALEGR